MIVDLTVTENLKEDQDLEKAVEKGILNAVEVQKEEDAEVARGVQVPSQVTLW